MSGWRPCLNLLMLGGVHVCVHAKTRAARQAGSIIGARARAAVREQVGVRMCCGIAHNKLLAKLASGLHKPDAQTSLPASEALDFLRPLPVQVLRGAGYKTCRDLQAAGIETVAQLRGVSKQRLMAMIGDRTGAHLFEAARGRDKSAVETTSAPKSITVEDSFKRCTSWQALALILEVLAPDLLARVDEDASLHRRLPATLTVTWRHATSKYGGRQSASTRFPSGQSLAPCDVRALQKRAAQIAGIAKGRLLARAPIRGC
jgi:DNA polymerase iota